MPSDRESILKRLSNNVVTLNRSDILSAQTDQVNYEIV